MCINNNLFYRNHIFSQIRLKFLSIFKAVLHVREFSLQQVHRDIHPPDVDGLSSAHLPEISVTPKS